MNSLTTGKIMPLDGIDDFEMRMKRHDAFWSNAVIDRPPVVIEFNKNESENILYTEKMPEAKNGNWLDADYQLEKTLRRVAGTEYFGDALPVAFPELGSNVLSAYLGLKSDDDELGSWSQETLLDWNDTEKIKFDENNFLWKRAKEITEAFLESGKNKFYTGQADFNPGGDAIAHLRGAMNLSAELIEYESEIKNFLKKLNEEYFKIKDMSFQKLLKASQPFSAWPNIVSSMKWSLVSNDYSCMVSKEMFDNIFLPGIIEECRNTDASIYHLDGPDALRHLDSLLDIPELNAIQWIYGIGNGKASDWMHVYKKCRDAGKGIQIFIYKEELDFFMENLKPEGVWLQIRDVQSWGEAENILRKISRWT